MADARRTSSFGLYLTAAVWVACGAVLRLLALGHASLWMDEAASLYAVSLPLGNVSDLYGHGSAATLLGQIATHDAHPPLFYLVLKWWVGCVGNGAPEWLLRLPFALASTAALACFAAVAHRLLDARTARLSVALAALSQASVWCGQEVRMYSLLGLWIMAASACGVRAWLDGWRAGWIGWTVCAVLAAYTHYLGLVYAVGFIAWTLSVDGRARSQDRWLALLAVAVLFAPWAPVMRAQMRAGRGPTAIPGTAGTRVLDEVAQTAVDGVWGPSLPLRGQAGAVFAVFAWGTVLTLVAAAWRLFRQSRDAATWVGWTALLPIGLLALASLLRGRVILQPRIVMYLAPCVAPPLAALCRKPVALACVLLLYCTGNALSLYDWDCTPFYARERARDATAIVQTRGDSLVLVEQPTAMFSMRYYLNARNISVPVESIEPRDVQSGRLYTLLKDRNDLWLILSVPWVVDPDNAIPRSLDARGWKMVDGHTFESYEPAYNVIVLHYRK